MENIINTMGKLLDLVLNKEKEKITNKMLKDYIDKLYNALNVIDAITNNKENYDKEEFDKWVQLVYLTSYRLFEKCDTLYDEIKNEEG